MNAKISISAIAAIGLWSSLAADAHHSFAAEFDAEAVVELHGYVTRVEWQNPHAFFYIDVESQDGTFVNWAIALGSPRSLSRNGLGRDALQLGDA